MSDKHRQKVKIFVVSLDNAKDRREAFLRRATSTSLNWQFFDAHRELSPSLSYTDSAALAQHGRTLSTGELGCYSSHVGLWEDLLADNSTNAYLILEDDVIVDWNIIERLALSGAGDIPYLRLYTKKPSRFQVVQRNAIATGYTVLRMLDKTWGTQAYYINKQAARSLLEKSRNVRMPIDDQMDRFWEHGVENLALFPHPIIEEFRVSSIGTRKRPDNKSFRRRLRNWIDSQRRRLYLVRNG